ncbi:cellulose binding domain-containing protein [uncultured Fibrella sp.]|uniref:cellulose binding domain-containing protein n=1 Tax=uncultured Fibrella sp. TaxID=1284596 RepID=UPI0035CA0DF4
MKTFSLLRTTYLILLVLVSFSARLVQASPRLPLAPTTATGPDVVVTARGENPPNEGVDKLTDGSFSTKWLDLSPTSFVQFAYNVPQIWTAYVLVSGDDAPERDPKNWTLQGSNDGMTWTTLDTKTGQAWSGRVQKRSFSFANTTAYRYYKLDITLNNGAPLVQLSELQLTTTDLLTPDVAVTARGDNPPGETIDRVYDGNPDTKWLDRSPTSFVQFAYTSPQTWTGYALTSGNDEPGRDPKDWTLQGSNDGMTWTTLDTKTAQTWSGRKQVKAYKFTNTTAYTYYKLNITANNGAPLLQLAELFLGTQAQLPPVVTVTARGGNPPNEGVDKVADGDQGSKWLDGSPTSWVQFAVDPPQVYNAYYVTSGNDAPDRDPKDWQIQVSNDGTNWTTLSTKTGQSWPRRNQLRRFQFANTTAYSYYRFNITANNGSTGIQLSELLFLKATPDSQSPTVPTSFSTVSATPVSLSVSWQASTDNSGVTEYEVYLNGTLVGTTLTPRYRFTDLDPATSYTITATALDSWENKSAQSLPYVATTPTATQIGNPVTINDPNFADAIRTLYPKLIGPAGNNTLTPLAAYVPKLEFGKWGATDGPYSTKPRLTTIEGIQGFINLEILDLFRQDLTTLPPLPKNLRFLSVRNNALLTSLPAFPATLAKFDGSFTTKLLCLPRLPDNFFFNPGDGFDTGFRLTIDFSGIGCLPNLPDGFYQGRNLVYPFELVFPENLCTQSPVVEAVNTQSSPAGQTKGIIFIKASVAGVNNRLEYSTNGLTFSKDNALRNLAPGNYTIYTRRQTSAGCPTATVSTTASVAVAQPARTVYVSLSGNDATGDGSSAKPWRTLRYATKQVVPGQPNTIQLGEGTFVEDSVYAGSTTPGPIILPTGTSLLGAGSGKTTIKVNNFYDLRKNPQDNQGYGSWGGRKDRFALHILRTSGILVKGFTLDGQDKKTHAGIYTANLSDAIFDDVTITNFRWTGLWLPSAQRVELKNSTLKNNAWGNVERAVGNLLLLDIDDASIHDNVIEETFTITDVNGYPQGAYAIDALSDGDGGNPEYFVAENVKIYRNKLTVLERGTWQIGQPAITIEVVNINTKNWEIYENQLNNNISLVCNPLPGITNGEERTFRIHDNVFDLGGERGDYRYALELNSSRVEFDHNYISGGVFPINQFDNRVNENAWIHHNTFFSPRADQPVIYFGTYATNFKFYNNTILDTQGAPRLFNRFVTLREAPPTVGFEVKNNVFISTKGPRGNWFPADNFGFTPNTPAFANNLFYNADPFGVNPVVVPTSQPISTILKAAGNKPTPFFELAVGSPAVDAGVVLAPFTNGFKGTAPDMGAYESDQSIKLSLLHQDASNGQATSNQIRPNLQLTNTGGTPVPYNQVTVRYWFTAEQFAPINTFIDYAQLGNGKVKANYVRPEGARAGADGYVEYSFDPSAGSLGANSGPIQSRFAKQDYTNFNQSDDYSFAANNAYTANQKITVYRNGQLVWGTEPAPVASALKLTVQTQNRNNKTTGNQISTYLALSNTGNVPVAYKDLSVRYWFTAEGTQPLTAWIDYTPLGSAKVKTRFVRPSPALPGADTYIEMQFDSTLGSLYGASTTGTVQYRIAKSDWSNFNEANDYSYKAAAPLADNDRVTVYYKGQLVWGTEPKSGGRLMAEPVAETLTVDVYPNPASSYIILRQGESTEAVDLTIYGIGGQMVQQQRIQFNSPVSTETLTPGLYLLRVQTGQRAYTLKLLKQ